MAMTEAPLAQGTSLLQFAALAGGPFPRGRNNSAQQRELADLRRASSLGPVSTKSYKEDRQVVSC